MTSPSGQDDRSGRASRHRCDVLGARTSSSSAGLGNRPELLWRFVPVPPVAGCVPPSRAQVLIGRWLLPPFGGVQRSCCSDRGRLPTTAFPARSAPSGALRHPAGTASQEAVAATRFSPRRLGTKRQSNWHRLGAGGQGSWLHHSPEPVCHRAVSAKTAAAADLRLQQAPLIKRLCSNRLSAEGGGPSFGAM
jgi:hypothetical protein